MNRSSSKIRILALLPEFPYPPHSGATIRMWHLFKNIGKEAHLTLICRSRDRIDSVHLNRFLDEEIQVKALHIQRPNLCQKLKKGLSFLVGMKPVTIAGWYFPDMARQIACTIRSHDFDVILMESSFMGVYWPVISNSQAVKALDLFDLMSERARRQAAIMPFGREKLLFLYDSLLLGRFENRLIKNTDLVLTISNRERNQIKKKHMDKEVPLVPNGVDCDNIHPLPIPHQRGILFVGTLDYQPNIDAVLFFIHGVLPPLRERYPDLKFWVVGKNPGNEITRHHGIEGVEVTGEVSSLEPYYLRCCVCVVPLRAGSGSRIKILEAMAYGRPVVSTTLGCEGLEVEDLRHLFIADTPPEMVEAIERIFDGTAPVKEVIQNGRKLVEEKYSWSNIANAMHACLRESAGKSRGNC
ncbi:MAG: glycosyltransferase [Deltaproteobacteria bacterium]|nr:glycosyltransferase [Deltaproteobacteria bacterium]MBW2111481.1 glycosyltransferase [Deltaproteobacteria bacterium]